MSLLTTEQLMQSLLRDADVTVNVKQLNVLVNGVDKEMERLKGLIEDAYLDGRNFRYDDTESITWDKFKTEHNL